MRITVIEYFIFSILLLVGVTSALSPSDITITSSPEWVVAGDSASTTIAVHVVGANITYNATIDVTYFNSSWGTIFRLNPTNRTDDNGNVSFSFTPKTISGDAQIDFTVTPSSFLPQPPVIITYFQKIDHSTPTYFESLNYPLSVNVTETAKISIRLKDDYGNIVDGRRPGYVHDISFAEAIRNDSGFDGIGIHSISKPVDITGNATVTYYVSHVAGDNIIRISAPATVVSNVTWIDIISMPLDPAYITSIITSDSDGNTALANGIEKFYIRYTIFDRYDNPVPSIVLSWSSSENEVRTYLTNSQGYVYLEYGPSTIIKNIILSASCLNVTPIQDTISFIAGGPPTFIVIPIPEIIASREANPNAMSSIHVKIVDDMGRPITGQSVTFKILSETANATITQNSSFEKGSKDWQKNTTSDEYGYADMPFYPGSFSLITSPDFNPYSSGTASINVRWMDASIDQTVEVTFKNYAYLHSVALVSPPIVAVNDTVNITIQLIGDGYAPWIPIDVMLCIGRGDTMFQDMYYYPNKTSQQDKMVFAHWASLDFASQFRPTIDQVGLVTFGPSWNATGSPWYPNKLPGNDTTTDDDDNYLTKNYLSNTTDPSLRELYYNYSTVDSNLAHTSSSDILDVLDKMTPMATKGGTKSVPIRYGLFKAIRELIPGNSSGTPNPESVKAVILLADASFTDWGDPLAGWDGQQVKVSQGYWPEEKDPTKLSQAGISEWTAFHELGSKENPDQNMAYYAQHNSIRIYTIAYFEKLNNIPTSFNNTLATLASDTGGKYYLADSGTKLSDIFYQIALELRTTASVDTSLNLSFANINIKYQNASQTFFNGSDVFQYIPKENVSTNVTSYNRTTDLSDLVLPFNPYPSDAIPNHGNHTHYPYFINQSDEWIENKLDFYIGNITIGQTWEATLQFRALKPGLINLFGNSSAICYSGESTAKTCIQFNTTYITVTENITPMITKANPLEIINHTVKQEPTNSTEFVNVSWNTYYENFDTINMKNYSVVQSSYYKFSIDGVRFTPLWTQFGINITTSRNISASESFSKMLDVTGLIGYIQVYVTAQEVLPNGQYGNFSWGSNLTPFAIGNLNQPYIKIT